MHVTVRKGRDGKPDVNGAMRVLKKKLMRDGFFQELRARESFMSKGEKERKAKAAGKRRYKRKQEKLMAERGYQDA